MSQEFDSPNLRLAPAVISKTIGGSKVSNVVVEVFDDDHKCWERTSNRDLNSLMSMLFDLSLSHDIIDIQAYGFQKDRYVYLSLKRSEDFTTNIDAEMLDAIGGIEFERGG